MSKIKIYSIVRVENNMEKEENAGYPITRRQILDSSKLKEFADNNFKFNNNGRKLSK